MPRTKSLTCSLDSTRSQSTTKFLPISQEALLPLPVLSMKLTVFKLAQIGSPRSALTVQFRLWQIF